jgi:hypothetical protein
MSKIKLSNRAQDLLITVGAIIIALIMFIGLLASTGCAADIDLTMTDVECGTVEVNYKSARKAAISMSCEGITVITGEVAINNESVQVLTRVGGEVLSVPKEDLQ